MSSRGDKLFGGRAHSGSVSRRTGGAAAAALAQASVATDVPADLKAAAPKEYQLFCTIAQAPEAATVPVNNIRQALFENGLTSRDPRLADFEAQVASRTTLSFQEFIEVLGGSSLIARALDHALVVADFPRLTASLQRFFDEAKECTQGDILAPKSFKRALKPEHFGVAICTIDAQRWSAGDADIDIPIHSLHKSISYCLALREHGEAAVHEKIGMEPSGRMVHELSLDEDNRPHNPFVNAGAIVACSLICPAAAIDERFEYVMKAWSQLSGGAEVGFNNPTFLEERKSSYFNYSLAYLLREKKVLSANGTCLEDALDLYFMSEAIEMSCESLSVVAAALANGGMCPTTGKRIFDPAVVRNCLSLMFSCGMYTASGTFAFTYGYPSKCSVTGFIMVIVPGVMGMCSYSPLLDEDHLSVRGTIFLHKMSEEFPFHIYDLARRADGREDGEHSAHIADITVIQLLYACAECDLLTISRLLARGVDVDSIDYDGRTGLHVAAAEGHRQVVEYLLLHGASPTMRDRNGATAADEAKRYNHPEVLAVLSAPPAAATLHDTAVAPEVLSAYNSLRTTASPHITLGAFVAAIEVSGIRRSDRRVEKVLGKAASLQLSKSVTLAEFSGYLTAEPLLARAISGNLTIPDFQSFSIQVKEIFDATAQFRGGDVARYIPQLAMVDPEQYGVAVCSVDGQQTFCGDYDRYFCIQSCSKPITYALALEHLGLDKVTQHVGVEPSGRRFNELALDNTRRPHNPLINAGAIMSCALMQPKLEWHERFTHVIDTWKKLAGGHKIKFSNATYLSEAATADRNFCLAYMMAEAGCFPENSDIKQALNLYFQLCSIEMTTEMMAVSAATLANNGVCPLTGEVVFSPSTVRSCLSVMQSCGMYDFSGHWAFQLGFPAKSGVGGGLMIVIPGVMGICTWSPRLDKFGNSVRGVKFCQEFASQFNVHNFGRLPGAEALASVPLKNLQYHRFSTYQRDNASLISAAAGGDLSTVRALDALGVALDGGDYDGRTALHLAAAEGQTNVVKYLLRRGVKPDLADRWGITPMREAERGKHPEIVELLTKYIQAAEQMQSQQAKSAPAQSADTKRSELISAAAAVAKADRKAFAVDASMFSPDDSDGYTTDGSRDSRSSSSEDLNSPSEHKARHTRETSSGSNSRRSAAELQALYGVATPPVHPAPRLPKVRAPPPLVTQLTIHTISDEALLSPSHHAHTTAIATPTQVASPAGGSQSLFAEIRSLGELNGGQAGQARVIHSGWLMKRGRLAISKFARRWFVLTDRTFSYYDSPTDSRIVTMSAVTPLTHPVAVRDGPFVAQKFFFELQTGDRKWYLYTESFESRAAWLTALREVIARLPAK